MPTFGAFVDQNKLHGSENKNIIRWTMSKINQEFSANLAKIKDVLPEHLKRLRSVEFHLAVENFQRSSHLVKFMSSIKFTNMVLKNKKVTKTKHDK